MVGIEVVTDRDPAPALAAALKLHAKRAHRVLLSTEGPYSSVLKIKPPMCFSIAQVGAISGRLLPLSDALGWGRSKGCRESTSCALLSSEACRSKSRHQPALGTAWDCLPRFATDTRVVPVPRRCAARPALVDRCLLRLPATPCCAGRPDGGSPGGRLGCAGGLAHPQGRPAGAQRRRGGGGARAPRTPRLSSPQLRRRDLTPAEAQGLTAS